MYLFVLQNLSSSRSKLPCLRFAVRDHGQPVVFRGSQRLHPSTLAFTFAIPAYLRSAISPRAPWKLIEVRF